MLFLFNNDVIVNMGHFFNSPMNGLLRESEETAYQHLLDYLKEDNLNFMTRHIVPAKQ